MLRIVLIYFLYFSLIFSPIVRAQSTSSFIADFDPPVIEHSPNSTEVPGGSIQTISATVTDNENVDSVILYFRQIGKREYNQIEMRRSDVSDVFIATIDQQDAVSPGLEYYIESRDISGNAVLEGYPLSPLVLRIQETLAPPQIADQSEQSESAAGITSSSGRKWLWIGLGALALGALAASGGGSGGDGGGCDGDCPDVPLNITVSPP